MNIKKYIYIDEGDKKLARVLAVFGVVLLIKVAIFSIQNAGVEF